MYVCILYYITCDMYIYIYFLPNTLVTYIFWPCTGTPSFSVSKPGTIIPSPTVIFCLFGIFTLVQNG